MKATKGSQPAKPWDGILVSIHMQSNRPDNFIRFLDRIERTASDPSCIEVIVKIDEADAAMNELLPREIARRRVHLKYISTPLPDGFYGLWRSMDEMFGIADPSTYFMLNLNDEMSIDTPAWDTILRRYVGLFPDDIFRLRTSIHRSRNYYDFWEAGFANDTSAFMTKRWLEIGGGWCPCNGPDTFQECVAFYLGYHRRFSNRADYRDIAIHDIEVRGHGASRGIDEAQLRKRARQSFGPWYRLMSHAMQQEASRRSQLLQAHIWASAVGIAEFDLIDNRKARTIDLIDRRTRRVCNRFSYCISWLRITTTNWLRHLDWLHYTGGAYYYHLAARVKKYRRRLITAFLVRSEWLAPYHKAYLQARLGHPLSSIEWPSRPQRMVYRLTLRLCGVKSEEDDDPTLAGP